MQCSCRGGRSLGKGSAGTVIVPQTPQEINRKRLPPPKLTLPLLPAAIAPPKSSPVILTNAVRSIPALPESKSAEADPVIVNPKSVGELKPFSPTISATPELITTPIKNLPTDNKATSPVIVLDPRESDGTLNQEVKSFDWLELVFHYLLFILIAVFIWTIYDIIKTKRNSAKIRHKNGVKKTARKKRKPITRKKK